MTEEILTAFPGSRFETGVEIQNASFHGQIFVASAGRFALVRVSNFGGFVTFFGDDDDCLGAKAGSDCLACLPSMVTHSFHLRLWLWPRPTMALVPEFQVFQIRDTDTLSRYDAA